MNRGRPWLVGCRFGSRFHHGPLRARVLRSANTELMHSTLSGETTNAVQLPDLTENQTAELERVDRPERDPWEQRIGDWLINRDTISVTEVLASCIDKPQIQWTQADKNRVASSLRALGWKRFQHRHGPRREGRYRRTQ